MRGRSSRRPWLIPAHAGKTNHGSSLADAVKAHPRSRGENYNSAIMSYPSMGSSPLTRGKQTNFSPFKVNRRLIPAHAGKTYALEGITPVAEAHPRSRGENFLIVEVAEKLDGSSPLTRGKRRGPIESATRDRLIPAHAGKTLRGDPHLRDAAAHPRSRGENLREVAPVIPPAGSSPLTRGKLPSRRNLASQDGLIPAHAGKTAPSTSSPWAGWAHPRSRGENPGKSDVLTSADGSSPLTRGKLVRVLLRTSGQRLIPAHAGKTSRRRCRRSPDGAHPRSRGENAAHTAVRAGLEGSSPLTRGKRGGGRLPRGRGRLIPAHAGKTYPHGGFDLP